MSYMNGNKLNDPHDIFKPMKEYEAVHNIMRHPHLISDFIEAVIKDSHRYEKSPFGTTFIGDRQKRDY
jgi:hypothetical protein